MDFLYESFSLFDVKVLLGTIVCDSELYTEIIRKCFKDDTFSLRSTGISIPFLFVKILLLENENIYGSRYSRMCVNQYLRSFFTVYYSVQVPGLT